MLPSYFGCIISTRGPENSANSRWLKSCSALPLTSHHSRNAQIEKLPATQAMTAAQCYNQADEVTKHLSLILSGCGTSVFQRRLQLLRDVVACWEYDDVTLHRHESPFGLGLDPVSISSDDRPSSPGLASHNDENTLPGANSQDEL